MLLEHKTLTLKTVYILLDKYKEETNRLYVFGNNKLINITIDEAQNIHDKILHTEEVVLKKKLELENTLNENKELQQNKINDQQQKQEIEQLSSELKQEVLYYENIFYSNKVTEYLTSEFAEFNKEIYENSLAQTKKQRIVRKKILI